MVGRRKREVGNKRQVGGKGKGRGRRRRKTGKERGIVKRRKWE